MNTNASGPCSIHNCPRLATHDDEAEAKHWIFTIHYCTEHHRQSELGTPLGPLGLDMTRVDVRARGIEEPATGGIMPSIGP